MTALATRTGPRHAAWVQGRTTPTKKAPTKKKTPPKPFPVALTLVLVGMPVLILLLRLPGMRTAPGLDSFLDLSTLPRNMRDHVHLVLFIPVGGLIITLARLVVGVRALGVLSPILLAVALPQTGYATGLLFATAVLLVVSLVVRPLLRAHGLPYSARVAALLSTAAALMLLPMVLLRHVSWAAPAVGLAYFPVVALGLLTERFATTLNASGWRIAAERAAVTMAEAVLIAFVSTELRAADLLARHPELLLIQIWCLVVVSRYLSLRLVERVRPAPTPVRPSKARPSKARPSKARTSEARPPRTAAPEREK